MDKRKILVPLVALALLSSSFGARAASGADPTDKKAGLHANLRSASTLSIGNGYVSAKIAQDGKFNFGLAPSGDSQHYNISFEWPYDPWTSMTTLRVDGSNTVLGESDQTQPPTNAGGLSNETGWRFGDVEVRQAISVGSGRPDAAQIRYTITNRGATAHDVGLRMLIDTMINDNDGAPYRLPGVSGDLEVVTTEREYSGAAVPTFWRAFHDLADPNVSAQWTLSDDGATLPDRLATARWAWIHTSAWDYQVDTNGDITIDSAMGMWWNPQSLAPGQTRTIIQYYGAPGAIGCSIGQRATAPPDIPEDSFPPMPEPPTNPNPGIPTPAPDPGLPSLTPDGFEASEQYVTAVMQWAQVGAATVRQANAQAKAETKAEMDRTAKASGVSESAVPSDGDGGGGGGSCYAGREVVANDEAFVLPHAYPVFERDGRVFYPATIEAMESLGFATMYRRESSLFGQGKRVIQLANGNTSIAIWADSGWALWDLQVAGPIRTFRSEGDKEIYYVDLGQVATLAGGWVKAPGETADGKYHVFIPHNIKGTWLRSCEARQYTVENEKITGCPNDMWMPGSTWDYVANRPGSDALDVIMVAHGLIRKHGIHDGDDPHHDQLGMPTSISENWGPVGLRHEGPTYNSFLYPLIPWLEQTAFTALDSVYVASQYRLFNQAMTDPAKTAMLGFQAQKAAEAERGFFVSRLDLIKRTILENGWNWIEIGGKRIYVPINVAPAESKVIPAPGWNLRVYGIGQFGMGGWNYQSIVGGTPEPRVFTLPDGDKEKQYVAMFEWASESKHFEDSQGEVILPGWTGEKEVTVEVKTGYEKQFIDPKTGDFTLDFKGSRLPAWLESFESSIATARANGRGHIMVFTNQRVYDAFVRAVKAEFGDEFYQKNAHRIIRTTSPVIRLSTGGLPPANPCGSSSTMNNGGTAIPRPCP